MELILYYNIARTRRASLVQHSVLLEAVFNAGVNGKAWRLIAHIYSHLQAVVRSGSSFSTPFSISRGVQQGSVLSPTLFLIVMDELLHSLRSNKSGISISNLYLGGAAHADDVRAVSTSAAVANCQSLLISDFASHHGLKLNNPKTEVVKFSQNKASHDTTISLLGSSICVADEAKCLGYTWNSTLNARSSVRENIHKARKSFFSLGSTGCFLGHSSPLTAKTIVETCVFPILLYGAENWILNDECLRLLEISKLN